MAQKKQGAPDAESIIARMNGGKSEGRFQKDQIVYSQGDPADSVYYTRSGKVKVTVVSNEGKEAVVAILLPGSFCGEECLTGHNLRLSTAKTLTECVLLRMAKPSVMGALHDDQQFAELFTTAGPLVALPPLALAAPPAPPLSELPVAVLPAAEELPPKASTNLKFRARQHFPVFGKDGDGQYRR